MFPWWLHHTHRILGCVLTLGMLLTNFYKCTECHESQHKRHEYFFDPMVNRSEMIFIPYVVHKIISMTVTETGPHDKLSK
jgi:hypothetical protein